MTKPDQGPKRVELNAFLAEFAARGLTPVLSTNGGVPEADIHLAKVTGEPEILDVWITAKGHARLQHERA